MCSEKAAYSPDDVRDDFIPKEVYYKQDFADLEAQHLWPYVWQIACRLEEIPEVGDYLTYNIVDDSIIIVRTGENTVQAHHNACPHRGRPLTEGTGNTKQFVCAFHGWRYKLNGENIKVVDKADWGGCLNSDDINLKKVQCDTWGGFVFINMDLRAASLVSFLDPIPEYCDKFEFDKLRFRWYKTAIMPANWKTVLGFFNEFYHVQQAHQQLLEFTNDYSRSGSFGRHSQIWYDADGSVPFKRSPRLPYSPEPPLKKHIVDFAENYNRDLRAMVSERNYAAIQRLKHEVADDAPPDEVMSKWVEFQIEAAVKDGAGWPMELTAEYIEKSGLDWHAFPNTIFLHGLIDSVLWYRVRPNGNNPDACIFDVWALDRYAPGAEPVLQREHYTDWRDGDWGLIYEQDFHNIPEVQKGFKSRGFGGERTNPIQERAISNFHRQLRRFLQDPYDNPEIKRPR
jgi:phenylpropionate dioxygenase-like ring-hydroxylating dioxygenase large terminal subunit